MLLQDFIETWKGGGGQEEDNFQMLGGKHTAVPLPPFGTKLATATTLLIAMFFSHSLIHYTHTCISDCYDIVLDMPNI